MKTVDVGLVFKRDDTCDQYAISFVDSDCAGDLDKGQSTTVYVFTLSRAPISWKSTKHIDVRYQFVREIISEGRILLQKIEVVENPVDLLTKVVTMFKFNHCLNLINIYESLIAPLSTFRGIVAFVKETFRDEIDIFVKVEICYILT